MEKNGKTRKERQDEKGCGGSEEETNGDEKREMKSTNIMQYGTGRKGERKKGKEMERERKGLKEKGVN